MPNTRKTKRTMLVPIPQVEDPIQDKYNKDLNTWLKQFVEQLSNQEYGITITDDDEFSVPLAFTLQFDNTILTDEGNGLVVIDPLGQILNPSTGELEFPNNKVGIDGASSPGFLGNAEDTGVLRTTTPFTYTDNGNSITLGIQQSSTSTDGYLNNIDWDTFNDKADYLFGVNSFSGTGDFFTTGDITGDDINASQFLGDVLQINTNTLVANLPGYEDKVGIGIVTPEEVLHTARSNNNNQIIIDTYDDGAANSFLQLRKSNNDTIGVKTETEDGDELGIINFRGVDVGSNFDTGAAISATQSGSAGTKIPTKLNLETWNASSKNTDQLLLSPDGTVSTSGDFILSSGKKLIFDG